MSRAFANDATLDVLSKAYEMYGRPLSKSEWNQCGFRPKASTICLRFGSWTGAWLSVGLTEEAIALNSLHSRLHRLLSSARDELGALGGCVKERDLRIAQMIAEGNSLADVGRQFGLSRERVRKIGASVYRRLVRRRYVGRSVLEIAANREEILEAMRKALAEYGRRPTQREWTLDGRVPSVATILKEFGPWGSAWDAVDPQ